MFTVSKKQTYLYLVHFNFFMADKFLIENAYIPLDKSWMIRIGILDLINGYDDTIDYLRQRKNELSDDLKALYQASIQWKNDQNNIDVGESGTLYRFLKFSSWKLNKNKKFILHGTLKDRKICNDPEIINWSLDKLLTLDNGTSQWASASVLTGSQEKIFNPPCKLQTTYDAVEHWNMVRKGSMLWEPRGDKTIFAQALAYVDWRKSGKMNFTPQQAEDYCFARAFNLISAEEGEKMWPSLRGHESDRIEEMEMELSQEHVTSADHRIIQAISMLKGNSVKIKYPNAVNKSWPQFFKFLEDCQNRTGGL